MHTLFSALQSLFTFLTLTAFTSVYLSPANALAFTQTIETSRRAQLIMRQGVVLGTQDETHVSDIYVGTDDTKPPHEIRAGDELVVTVTAYSSTPEETDSSPLITASGRHVSVSTMAANFLPMGTRVSMNGHLYTVWDRLNARYNGAHVVDVWLPTREQALQFGVRGATLKVISLP